MIESPEKWHFPYFKDEAGEIVGAQIAAADTMLLGRRTYEEFAGYWPTASDEMAGFMNNTPKLVVSQTLKTVAWQNRTLVTGDIEQELIRIKAQPGKNLAITGSATLVRSLLAAGLLDELNLLVHPIVVGTGRRLFEDGGATVPLELANSKTLKTGVIATTYVPTGRTPTA